MSCKEKSQNACFASVFKNVLDSNQLATFSLPSPQISYDIFDCRKPKNLQNKGIYCLVCEKTKLNLVSPRIHTLPIHLFLPAQRAGFCPQSVTICTR